jgi:hypothetical protein
MGATRDDDGGDGDDLWHGGNPPKTFAILRRIGAQDAKVETEFKDML